MTSSIISVLCNHHHYPVPILSLSSFQKETHHGILKGRLPETDRKHERNIVAGNY